MSGGAPRLGLIAFGDSITHGGGELQWGVALQSWALWTARGLGLPYTSYAVDGARAADIAGAQLRAVAARTAHPDGRYDVGTLYAGVNDVRAPDWDRERFAAEHRTVLDWLAARCERVLTATIPLDLGRPRPPAGVVAAANAAIEAGAAATGALVLDLRDFRGRNLVMADHVHPTAFGQIALAERALAVLAADGLPPRVHPSALVVWDETPRGRARGDLTYAWRHLKVSLRAARLRLAALRREAERGA